VKIVASADAAEMVRQRGALFVWPRALRCCGGRQYTLEASTARPPAGDVELVHAADGYQVWAAVGLRLPDELHVELDRKGAVRAYWNNQAWIG
jgi:hypothetical protein